MAEVIGIAALSGQVAQFGLRVSGTLHNYSNVVSSSDDRINDLAKDVELTAGIFQDAERVFDNPETNAVRNQDADDTAQNLINKYQSVLEDLDTVLEEGRAKKSRWPFRDQNLEVINAELDLNNGGMRLLLMALRVAASINAGNALTETDDNSMQKMEEILSALEATSRRLEAARTEAILTGGSPRPAPAPEDSFVADPTGSTEFTYIDDSPPSPSQPVVQASAFSDSSPSVGIQPDTSNTEGATNSRSHIPSVDLETCIEHVQGVLRQIEEAKASGDVDVIMSSTATRDLVNAYASTEAVLEQIMKGKGSLLKPEQPVPRETSQGSLDASTGLGGSVVPCQRRIKKWKSKMEEKIAEEYKSGSKWTKISLTCVQSQLRKPVHHFLQLQKRYNRFIKFVDVLDRTFSFPWKFCCTWKGMEDLIKQAFLSDASICHRVYKGHYELVGPDGAIILPMLWTTVVQPGWTITMKMPELSGAAHVSHAPPVILSDDPWLNLSPHRGRSLKRPGNHSPVIIDVCEGPEGVQVIHQDEPEDLYSVSRKTRSAPNASFYRTASVAARPVTEIARRRLSPTRALLIDVSPRPRTRGKSRSGRLRSLSPVPPPPPPPPPPPVVIDASEEPESIRVLSPDFSISDSDDESGVISGDESLLGSLGACGFPGSAEEAVYSSWRHRIPKHVIHLGLSLSNSSVLLPSFPSCHKLTRGKAWASLNPARYVSNKNSMAG